MEIVLAKYNQPQVFQFHNLGVLMGKLRVGYVYEWPMLQSYLLPNPTHEFMVSMRLFGGDAVIW